MARNLNYIYALIEIYEKGESLIYQIYETYEEAKESKESCEEWIKKYEPLSKRKYFIELYKKGG